MTIDKTNVINSLITQSIEDASVYLVDVEIKGNENQPVLWVYLDTEDGGITLEQCAAVSRRLNVLIEENGSFGNNFQLNVSSPGLNRPLKDIRQYKNNIGRTAKVRYKSDDKVKKAEGVITSVTDQQINIEKGNNNISEIAFDDIIETKILAVI